MTTLIKNGLVYDGSGTAPVKTDILVRGNHIVRVGEIGRVRTNITIDATGAIVTPGFIDVGSEIDHYATLFTEPGMDYLLRQGITTALMGNGGVSLAPFPDSLRSVSGMWEEAQGIHVRGETVKEFLNFIEKCGVGVHPHTNRGVFGSRHLWRNSAIGVGVNVGTLAGYTTLRRAFTRDAVRDLTEREIAAVEHAAARACRDGAFGVSVGFTDSHLRRLPHVELRMLATLLARHHRVLSIALRREGDEAEDSLRELLAVARETGVSVDINQLEPLAGHRARYSRILALLDEATTDTNVHFDLCAGEDMPVPLISLLPEWLQNVPRGELLRHLGTAEGTREVTAYLERYRDIPFTVAYVPQPHLASLEGKPLAELSLHGHHPFGRALLALMRATELRAVLAAPLTDPLLLPRFLSHSRALITTGGLPRGSRQFPSFLRLAERGALPLERAVEKLTALPAKKFDIIKRGLVRSGYFADIVVLRNGMPTDVLVNGHAAFKDGRAVARCYGAVLRSKTPRTPTL